MNRKARRAAAKLGGTPSDPRARAAPPSNFAVSQLFAAGLQSHQAGRLAEAEACYRRVLVTQPDYAEVHLQLGLALKGQGKLGEAIAAYRRAIAIKPDLAEAQYNLGNALNDQGKLKEAIAVFRQAITIKPDWADAHLALGNALNDQGKHEEAITAFRQVIAIDPDYAVAHSNLGVALNDLGELDEAIAAYRRAIAIKPDYAAAHSNLGNTLRAQGKLDEAIAVFRQAIAIRPDLAGVHSNLGNALRDQGKLDEAIATYFKAIVIKPDYAEAHSNLGNVLREMGKLDEAIMAYRRALAIRPDLAETYSHLGVALYDQGKFDEAVTACRRSIAIKPGFAAACSNLGNALREQGKVDEAISAYRQAIALRPDLAEAYVNLGVALCDQGKLDEAVAACRQAIAIKPDFAEAHNNLLMELNCVPGASNAVILDAARRFGETFDQPSAATVSPSDRDCDRRLRIGYVSGDFRYHPVGYFLARVLSAHDRNAVEVFCYTNSAIVDAMTHRLRVASDHWRSIVGMSDADAASLIRRDGVDILIDLSGHTSKNRLPLFALRPAPVQASWLGYFGTTGLAAMDYVLMDAVSTPPGEERWYSEAVARLPYGRFCYEPPEIAPEPVDPPFSRRGHVTFGSFGNTSKIGPDVVRLWAKVLLASPEARLVCKWRTLGENSSRRRLIEAFAAAGVSADRLELRGFSPHREMLAEYGDIDIALDPFPFGGGLTSCEALWMGVPVVTLPGDLPASRQTLGFLQQAGLEDLAAASPADYVAKAASLSRDPHRLTLLRHSLRPRLAASPMCDGPLFTGALESAFREMWRRFCFGRPAATFDVAPLAVDVADKASP
jgi:protein O-GlcNAc transferase